MKQFTIPFTYRSKLISSIKNKRKAADKMKKDFSPTLLKLDSVEIYLARHFGFCYGVENAIEIAFKTIEENPGKRIFLLSEMIHNPAVNADLINKGVMFLQDTAGKELISYDSLNENDIVLIPAFGTTLHIEKKLKDIGISVEKYNTTCPFVEKVWNRSKQIADNNYTVIVHGKPVHEETRATFSHASAHTPTLVINDMAEAISLAGYMRKQKTSDEFYKEFAGRFSVGFDPKLDLERIGVVNQTTMLAEETQAIADYLKSVVETVESKIPIQDRFADTKDTLCYATNDNQSAVYNLLKTKADFAIVVGGYNSSNTSHLVELCEKQLPTFFINDETKIIDDSSILHYDLHDKTEKITHNYIPSHTPVRILLTSGASCPDAIVERVIQKIAGIFKNESELSAIADKF